jgi:hypothetical protein
MNAHVEYEEAERLHAIIPEWRGDGRTVQPRSVKTVSPVNVLVCCQASLEAYLTRCYRVTEEQATIWLGKFMAAKLFPMDCSGSAFRAALGKSLHRFAGQQLRSKREGRIRAANRLTLAEPICTEGWPVARTHAIREFNVAWARGILTEALRRMKRHCQASDQAKVWRVFENRILQPMLGAAAPPAYLEFIRRFGLRSPSEASRLLLLGRQMFGQFLRTVVTDYSRTPRQVEEEIRELKTLLYLSE